MEITQDGGESEKGLNAASSIQLQDQVAVYLGISVLYSSFGTFGLKKIAFHMDNKMLCSLMYFCPHTVQTYRQFGLVSKLLANLTCLVVQFSPLSTMMVLDVIL